MPAEEHAALAEAMRDTGDPGAGRRLTSRWRAQDRSLHWIEWSLRPTAEDRVVYASGRDVTQDLLAERALASSENRYRTLVDGLPDTAVFLVDGDLRVEFAAGQPLHDGTITPTEFIGQAVDASLPEPESAALVDACSAALAGDERSLDVVAAGNGHALSQRTSRCPATSPGWSRARCSSSRTFAGAWSASASSAPPKSASGGPSRAPR